jgi:opacity protein-like surface antigen
VAPFFYADNSEFDDVDQDYIGRFDYQFTPKFNGRADAFFIVDNRPDRDLLTVGQVQGVDRRYRYHVGGGADYTLSEKAAVDLTYDYNQDDWDKDVEGREDLTKHVANLGLSYNLAGLLEATTGRLSFGYGNYEYDTSETDSFYGSIGINNRLSEIFRINLNIGARYVDSEFDVNKGNIFIGQESNSGWGAIGSAILGYQGEKTRSSLLASRDLSTVSGRQGPTALTRVVFSASHRFLEDLRLAFLAGFYHNKADKGDFSDNEIDQYTLRIRPSIRWEFYDNFTLEGAYAFTYRENLVVDPENKERTQNLVYVQVAYGLPLFDYLDLFSAEGQQVISGAVPLSEPR